MLKKIFTLLFVLSSFGLLANGEDSLDISADQMEELVMFSAYIDSVNQALEYTTDQVTLEGGIATINVPEGYKFLNGPQSEQVLTEVWGNPPSDKHSLGMLFPIDGTPFADSTYAIDIEYVDDGYISDLEAKKINYDDLLVEMMKGAEESNKYRKEQGYESVHLLGWASPPFYDEQAKKLHWAKKIRFDDSENLTLNYNIRVLGRKGYLDLTVIGGMEVLDKVKTDIDIILGSVNFEEGNKYSDFNPKIDKIAKYGIGALIAGKVIAKVGILAKLGIMLAKFWKIIVLFFVGIGSAIKKFFGVKTKEKSSNQVEVIELEKEDGDDLQA